jgi:hypothetical protein
VGSRDLATLKGLLLSDAVSLFAVVVASLVPSSRFCGHRPVARKALDPPRGPLLTGRDPAGIVLWVCTQGACTCLE